MSAVNMNLVTLQVVPGVFFQRQHSGALRVMVTNGEAPLPNGTNLRADFVVTDEVLSAGMSVAEYKELEDAFTLESMPKLAGDGSIDVS